MPEMDYSTQAAQAKLSHDAARAAEARMRSEGTKVASPEGMALDEGDMEDETLVTPEEEAALHGADSESAPTTGSDAEGDSSEGDALSVGSVGGTEVHDDGEKTA